MGRPPILQGDLIYVIEPVPLLDALPVCKTLNSRYHSNPRSEMIPARTMADPKSFLDNLKNLRLVMSVAFEHIQANRNRFVKDANGSQVRQFDRTIGQIRILAEQIEKEIDTLEYLIAKRPSSIN